jgi:hypothetical protein
MKVFPFTGCQGRLNRSSIMHAVSVAPHAIFHFLQGKSFSQMVFTVRKFEFIFENAFIPFN